MNPELLQQADADLDLIADILFELAVDIAQQNK